MKKKTALIILYGILVLIVAAFIYQLIVDKEINSDIIRKALIPFVIFCVSAIVKVSTGAGSQISNKRLYAEQYKKELSNAFDGEDCTKQYKQLMDAIALYNQNQFKRAINKLEKLIPYCRTNDDYCAVLMFMALTYTDMGMTESAIGAYEELLKHDGTRSTVWSNLGLLYKEQGKNKDAISCLNNALHYDGENPYAYNNLANVYFVCGNYENAIIYAEKALELKNNLYQASNTLCLSYCAMQKEEESKRYFQLSIANGADAKILKEALKTIHSGAHIIETLEPISEELQEAYDGERH